MTSITVSDADYQALEKEMALEILGLWRERTVLVRRVLELERENAALKAAGAPADKEHTDEPV